ncbi:carbonic anhydrase [Singulisphaera sp. PoT]|uniref:carbonic anhydrase n=1 Tax=Singulisphaera sp. PoT TaxID=3411797 RepID=UPI003BF5229D
MDELTTQAMGKMPGKYPPPRHNVLVLSCMDLRLIDELAAFMDRDNLTNRYDHLVIAGAALGVTHHTKRNWKKTFFEHLAIALELHEPHDVYIIEHRNCGAYRKILGLDFDDHQLDEEKVEHGRWATKLRREIEAWWPTHAPKKDGKPLPLHVHGFLMDLRGDIELLDLSYGKAPSPRKSRKPKPESQG